MARTNGRWILAATFLLAMLALLPHASRSETRVIDRIVAVVDDDAIFESDALLGQLLEELARLGELDRTIVVYYSDHLPEWAADAPIPLLFALPGAAPRGVLETHAQLLDVAPTLLDAIGLPVPAWMEGDSLLGAGPAPDRPLFASTAANGKPITPI